MLGGGHALENAGHHIRRIPIVGNTLAKLSVPAVICSRRLIAAVHGLVNGVISTIEGIAYGLSAALSRSGNGLKACAVGKFGIAWHEIKAAAVLVLRFPFDAALMATATTISTIQTTLFLEHMGRRLSCREVSMLKHVFGNSVDYSAVTIKEGFAGVASTSDRAFVTGNTIYMKDIKDSDGYLVHEMTHVWQHQHRGTDYMIDALIAQHSALGYDWTKSAPHTPWDNLNPEQQAQLLEDAQSAGYFSGDHPFVVESESGERVDYTNYLNDALSNLRAS